MLENYSKKPDRREKYAKKTLTEMAKKCKHVRKLWKESTIQDGSFLRWIRRLEKEYQLPLKIYMEMWNRQKGKCAICEGAIEVVDHCHSVEKSRGLLCHKCNKGLGLFEDNPRRLKRALDYVTKFSRIPKKER